MGTHCVRGRKVQLYKNIMVLEVGGAKMQTQHHQTEDSKVAKRTNFVDFITVKNKKPTGKPVFFVGRLLRAFKC